MVTESKWLLWAERYKWLCHVLDLKRQGINIYSLYFDSFPWLLASLSSSTWWWTFTKNLLSSWPTLESALGRIIMTPKICHASLLVLGRLSSIVDFSTTENCLIKEPLTRKTFFWTKMSIQYSIGLCFQLKKFEAFTLAVASWSVLRNRLRGMRISVWCFRIIEALKVCLVLKSFSLIGSKKSVYWDLNLNELLTIISQGLSSESPHKLTKICATIPCWYFTLVEMATEHRDFNLKKSQNYCNERIGMHITSYNIFSTAY